jgi:hypothetical protein
MSDAGNSASRSLGAIAVAGLVAVHGLGVWPGALGFRSPPAPAPRRLAVVDGLGGPEAVSYDPARDAYYVSNVNGQPGDREPTDLAPGPGKFDGLEVEADGRVLLTSWNDSSIFELRGTRLGRAAPPAWSRLPHREPIRALDSSQ